MLRMVIFQMVYLKVCHFKKKEPSIRWKALLYFLLIVSLVLVPLVCLAS